MTRITEYFSKQQALGVLSAPNDYHLKKARQAGVTSVKVGNRHFYHRQELLNYLRLRLMKDQTLTEEDINHRLDMINEMYPQFEDIMIEDYVTLTEVLKDWPYTKEYLYQLTSYRSDNPKIQTVTVDGLMLFERHSVAQYLAKAC